MKEQYEFRLFEREASKELPSDVGRRLSPIARQIVAERATNEFIALEDADRRVRDRGGLLVASWSVRRSYSAAELARAEWFRVQLTRVFEPAGESCGTEYDDAGACDVCGFGGRRTSALRLDPATLPRRAHLARTIANEVVADLVLVDAARDSDVRGIEFLPLQPCHASSGEIEGWRSVEFDAGPALILGKTNWGHTPFDLDTKRSNACPKGHVGGLNILSELHLLGSSLPVTDFVLGSPAEGPRAGVLRPMPPIIASRRGFEWLKSVAPHDVYVEVAHIH